jgi:hypothetical protein
VRASAGRTPDAPHGVTPAAGGVPPSLVPFRLPPPDPFESLIAPPSGDVPMPGPAAVFLGGTPSSEVERLSDAILAARPGALVVAVRE